MSFENSKMCDEKEIKCKVLHCDHVNHTCIHCNKLLATRATLLTHMKRIHTLGAVSKLTSEMSPANIGLNPIPVLIADTQKMNDHEVNQLNDDENGMKEVAEEMDMYNLLDQLPRDSAIHMLSENEQIRILNEFENEFEDHYSLENVPEEDWEGFEDCLSVTLADDVDKCHECDTKEADHKNLLKMKDNRILAMKRRYDKQLEAISKLIDKVKSSIHANSKVLVENHELKKEVEKGREIIGEKQKRLSMMMVELATKDGDQEVQAIAKVKKDKCRICPNEFQTEKELREHIQMDHLAINDIIQTDSTTIDSPPEHFTCKYCSKTCLGTATEVMRTHKCVIADRAVAAMRRAREEKLKEWKRIRCQKGRFCKFNRTGECYYSHEVPACRNYQWCEWKNQGFCRFRHYEQTRTGQGNSLNQSQVQGHQQVRKQPRVNPLGDPWSPLTWFCKWGRSDACRIVDCQSKHFDVDILDDNRATRQN